MLKELNTNKLIVELQKVLILVLMEHAQRVRLLSVRLPSPVCLNPCFNGTCSKSYLLSTFKFFVYGLNPCFNGTSSKRNLSLWLRIILS